MLASVLVNTIIDYVMIMTIILIIVIMIITVTCKSYRSLELNNSQKELVLKGQGDAH